MPRREDVPEEERAAYDAVLERQLSLAYAGRAAGSAGPYFDVLLHSPALAKAISDGGRIFRTARTYSPADREWIDMVVSHELGCNRVLGSHMPDAVAVGVRPEAIRALRDGRDDDLTPDERELAAYIREVVHGRVRAESFAGIRKRFGDRGAVEFTSFVAWLMMTDRLMQAFHVPALSDEQLDELLQGFLDGTAEVPDPELRIG
jgi:alkylhydroperoxidase family enzyme